MAFKGLVEDSDNALLLGKLRQRDLTVTSVNLKFYSLRLFAPVPSAVASHPKIIFFSHQK
jgi:hypothetical protein